VLALVVVMSGRVVYTVAVSDFLEFENFFDEASLHLREASGVTEVGARDYMILTKLAGVVDEVLAVRIAHDFFVKRRAALSSAGVERVVHYIHVVCCMLSHGKAVASCLRLSGGMAKKDSISRYS